MTISSKKTIEVHDMGEAQMSPVDQLCQQLKTQFPDAEIETRKADDPNGFQFLSLFIYDFEVGVEWKSDCGFGISSFRDDSSLTEGLFDSPNEWYSTEQAAFHRVASLVFDQRSTRPRQSKISDIRHDRGMSQEVLSEQLSVKQATYSKLERRKDVKVSSLRQVIEAMGGKLVIQAIFADTRDVREITFK
jgi:DNA-binding Xre family transcriptional regulator